MNLTSVTVLSSNYCVSFKVTLVGVVRAVETTSVKVTYTLEDDTGLVEGVHWIDGVKLLVILIHLVKMSLVRVNRITEI